MDIKMKSPLILAAGLSVIFLSLAGGAFFFLQQERAKSTALQAQLEEVRTKQKFTEAKLQESQKLASALEDKLKEAELQVESITNELQQEKTVKEEALASAQQLKTELEQQKGMRTDLENKFNQTQKNLERLQAQVVELENKRKELEAKMKDSESQQAEKPGQPSKAASGGVELGKIVVSPEAKKAGAPKDQPAEGQVLVVNKDYSFAVISLGLRDGVSVGDVYSVYDEDKYLGDVKIEKVHDSMSAAGFSATAVKEKIAEGDRVVPKGK